MRFLIVGDLHGVKPRIRFKEFDAIIAPGDFCYTDKVRRLHFRWIRERKANPDITHKWYSPVGKRKARQLIQESLDKGRAILEYLNKLILWPDVIYSAVIAMAVGAIVIIISRRDLMPEVLFGGLLFMVVYIAFALVLTHIIFPGWIMDVWNLERLSGFVLLGVPIEEYLWGFTFGALWAPLYEDAFGYLFQ